MKQNTLKLTKLLFAFAIMCLPHFLNAQNITVKGKVTDANGTPVESANIAAKGSKKSAISRADGSFEISAPKGEKLTISFIGSQDQQVIASDDFLTIQMVAESKEMSTVVVTALGIKKDKRTLGYSIQEVKGNDLIKARDPNAINGLVGKVAGLSIGQSAEILGRPQILLRGNSLSFFVVDGVPINSDTWNISPDDIESYTVLKGPTAAALYGSRAVNGAIIINTKKGSKDKRGFSVEFNSSTMFESGFNAIPKVQDEYGPGDHGKYAFIDGRGGGLNDGDYDVWGPKFEGQLITQYDSPIDPVTGNRVGTPWIARGKNNLSRFIETGMLSTNNIAVSSSNEKSDLRFSFTNTYQKGIVPNTKLNGINFNSSITHKFSDKIKFEANVNYNRQYTPNVPDVQYGPNSLIYNVIIWAGADWDVDQLRNYWQPGKEGVQQIYAEYQRYNNPWFTAKEWLRGHYKNDFYGYMTLSYKLNKNFELVGRSSVTTYDLLRNEKMPYSATSYGREEARGDYREDTRKLFENNTELLLKFNTAYKGFKVSGLAGGNARTMRYNSSFVSTNYLNVPGIYTFGNSSGPVVASNFSSQLLVASIYGSADFSYKKYLNLNTTVRTDKSSAIPGAKSSLYPSASLSTVISDYIKMPEAISFFKLKGSFASVRDGGTSAYVGPSSYPVGYGAAYTTSYDGPTYDLVNKVYSTRLDYNNTNAAYYTDNLYDDIRTALRTNYEAGFDISLFKNRVNLDAVYFTYVDGPQIYRNPISQTTGYTSLVTNATKFATKGFEVSLNAKIIKSNNFSWDVLANWSTYKQTYAELPTDSILVGQIFVKKGDRLDIYQGRAFARTQTGEIINDGGGRPIVLPKNQILGNASPDWVWGFVNKFNYKNFSLLLQIDGRVGGVMENYIRRQTFRGGRHIETIQGELGTARYQDYVGVKSYLGEGVQVLSGTPIFDPVTGVITNYKDLTFKRNATLTYAQDYVSRYNSQAEGNLMNKTFAKLREITLGYTLPQSFLNRTFIQSASISFVARNLFYFADKKHKDLDLDQYAGTQTSSNLQTPTVKRFGFNLNIVF